MKEDGDDDYVKHNFDWMAMASLFIKHRINTNHMSASGPVKDAADITIEDFVPTDTEKNYILGSHGSSSSLNFGETFSTFRVYYDPWTPDHSGRRKQKMYMGKEQYSTK